MGRDFIGSIIAYAAANPGIAVTVILIIVSAISLWLLYEHIILGICDCSCGPGKCECECGCRDGCPCWQRDKSAANDRLRNSMRNGWP